MVSAAWVFKPRRCLWLLALLLTACSSQQLAPLTERTSDPGWRPNSYQIKPGDTLYSIAWEFGFDYRQLARWNRIPPPYKIITASRLRLNQPPTTATRALKTPRPTASKKKGLVATTSKSTRRSKPTPARALPSASQNITWQWPTIGTVKETYSAKLGHNRGINITGQLGQPINAAAAGTVVYAGSGLKAYGRMVIIKHSEKYLSAYAHNQTMSVTEGQWVKAGQKIGNMGRNTTGKVMLHFEIRSNGKPTNPEKLLPRTS